METETTNVHEVEIFTYLDKEILIELCQIKTFRFLVKITRDTIIARVR